jgi:hypothetical protein
MFNVRPPTGPVWLQPGASKEKLNSSFGDQRSAGAIAVDEALIPQHSKSATCSQSADLVLNAELPLGWQQLPRLKLPTLDPCPEFVTYP